MRSMLFASGVRADASGVGDPEAAARPAWSRPRRTCRYFNKWAGGLADCYQVLQIDVRGRGGDLLIRQREVDGCVDVLADLVRACLSANCKPRGRSSRSGDFGHEDRFLVESPT